MSAGDAIRNAAPQPQFSQTAFVFGTIAFMFLLYVTIKGDLPKWLGLIFRSPTQTGAGGLPGLTGLTGLTQPGTNGGTASQAFATPGTNSAGSAVPDILSGNHDVSGTAGGSPLPSLGSDALIPNYDGNGQWIGYTRP